MSLDPATTDALRARREAQARERREAGAGWQARQYDWLGNDREDLVFTYPDGSLTYPQNVTSSKHWNWQ